MFFKKKQIETTPKTPEKFWVALFYDGDFKPSKDNSLLSFEFQVDEDSENEEKFREMLPEFISDVCKDYQTAIIIKGGNDPSHKEFNSVEIGNGADISSLKSYYENDDFAFSADLYVISSKREIQIRDENTDELIKKLLDMPYIFYLYFDCVVNRVEMCVDVNVIDADSIVESVKKLCEKKGIDLYIYIFYDKPKSGE